MNALPSNRRKRAAAMLMLGGGLLATAGLGYGLLTPRTYVASATLRVWKGSVNNQTNHAGARFDPATTLPGQCQFIRSQALLDPVIAKLGLNELWGKRYHQGVTLATAETRQRLLGILTAEPAGESGIIRVSVASGDDPVQAAAIANEIVRAYDARRGGERDELARAPVDSIDRQVAEMDGKINEAESNLAALAQSINFAPATNSLKYFSPELYAAAESNRAALQAKFDAQKRQVAEMKAMNGQALVDAASALDNPTNALLAPTVNQWNQARARLAAVEATQRTNSPDALAAKAAADELATIAEQTARSLVAAREAQLAGMNAALGAMNEDLRNVTTNMQEFIAGHPDYRDALAKFQELKARRADLQQKLMIDDPRRAGPVETLNTKIVELADPPARPATPNRNVVAGLVAAGLFLGIIGGCVQFVKPATKRTAGLS